MKFNARCVYTGKTEKKSKKGNKYILVNFLDDNGKTFTVLSVVDVPENIKMLEVVNVEFELVFGRNIYLRVNKIWKE